MGNMLEKIQIKIQSTKAQGCEECPHLSNAISVGKSSEKQITVHLIT